MTHPAARDAETTRRRIVAAALKEFAAKGISGARVDAIAARARTNKRMLYYYFGSKQGLFRETLRHRLAERAPMHHDDPVPAWGDRLVRIYEGSTANPDWVRLLMWEALERDARRPAENEDLRVERYRKLAEQVRAAQADGELPADLDPEQLVLSELALALFPLAFPQVTRMVTGRLPTDPAFRAERRRHLEALAAQLTENPDRLPEPA